MVKGKFERTKPHVNVGTIGHLGGRAGLGAAIAHVLTTAGPWQNRTGTETYVNMNRGPMIDDEPRAARRNPKKHRNTESKYKKGRKWWE